MKLYIIAHKGKPSAYSLEAWLICNKIGENGIFVESVNAFIRKKDAKKWLDKRGYKHLEIKTFEYLN